jgi:hypothetical protein
MLFDEEKREKVTRGTKTYQDTSPRPYLAKEKKGNGLFWFFEWFTNDVTQLRGKTF